MGPASECKYDWAYLVLAVLRDNPDEVASVLARMRDPVAACAGMRTGPLHMARSDRVRKQLVDRGFSPAAPARCGWPPTSFWAHRAEIEKHVIGRLGPGLVGVIAAATPAHLALGLVELG
jgi:hypothetical protein